MVGTGQRNCFRAGPGASWTEPGCSPPARRRRRTAQTIPAYEPAQLILRPGGALRNGLAVAQASPVICFI